MRIPHFGCIVEGHGDVDAVPALMHKVAALVAPDLRIRVKPAFRLPRGQIVKRDELLRAIDLATRRLAPDALLIVFDADDDLPCQLGPQIQDWAAQARPDVPSAVLIANREYETWFLAGAESLSGHRGLPHGLVPPPDPEGIRGAKEWLGRQMTHGRGYRETIDQEPLTRRLDLALTRGRSPSFDKFCREMVRLCRALTRP